MENVCGVHAGPLSPGDADAPAEHGAGTARRLAPPVSGAIDGEFSEVEMLCPAMRQLRVPDTARAGDTRTRIWSRSRHLSLRGSGWTTVSLSMKWT